jgi:hypothetical protein
VEQKVEQKMEPKP